MTTQTTFRTYNPDQSLISQVEPMHISKLAGHTVTLFQPLQTSYGLISLIEERRTKVLHKSGEIVSKELVTYSILMQPLFQDLFFSEMDEKIASEVLAKQSLEKLEKHFFSYFS